MALSPALAARLFPFLRWRDQVTRETLRADGFAGLTGALIVLPQGVAFATIAGLPPQYGLYAAMIPAIIAALWGSSWHLVSGPTTAISIAIYATLSPQGEPGSAAYIQQVLTLTFLVGVLQLALGLARMGALVNFISHTVVIGFTSGAAVLIAASQAGSFFGLAIPRGAPFYEIGRLLLTHFTDSNPYVLGVSLATLATGILARRLLPKLPYMIIAMLAGSLVAWLLNSELGVATTGIRTVGALPSGLPPFSRPDFSLGILSQTLMPALAITMLALTEAVSIARAIAVRSEQRIDANQEFIGQGLSNIVGAFFSCFTASGSFNRSGINFEAGARTPLASVFASLFLVLVLLLVAPLAAYLPTAAMAAILFMVAWGLIDFHHIQSIWQTSKIESVILAATLIGTLFNLEAGIFIGVFLSLVFYLYRSSRPEVIPVVPATDEGAYHFVRAQNQPGCPQLCMLRVNGSLYFGAANFLQNALQQIDEDNPQHKSVLIVAGGINYIDIACAEVLAQEARRRRRSGGGLYFYRLNRSLHSFLRQGGYADDIGVGAFFPVMTNVTGALYWTLDPDICRGCKTRIFKECNGGLLPDGGRRQRLLLATDGGEASAAATAIAIELGRRFGVTLDLMTAVSTPADTSAGQQRLAPTQRASLLADVDCELIVQADKSVARAILDAADSADTSLLVIGHHAATEDRGRYRGNISLRVIEEAHCHVLLCGPRVSLWSRRILLLIDGNDDNESGIDLTTQIAVVTRTPVTVLAVAADAAAAAALEPRVRHVAGLMGLSQVNADQHIVIGQRGAATVATARALAADLVVIGRERGAALTRLLSGSLFDTVVNGVDCAVLITGSAERSANIVSAIADEL
jgi:SulP family sulfate permease